MTRSEALEVVSNGIVTVLMQTRHSPTMVAANLIAQAALQALEGVGMVVVPRARVPASMDDVDGQLPILCPSQDHAPSTEKARADGLAGPQSSGAEG